jgi:hypothetical protein
MNNLSERHSKTNVRRSFILPGRSGVTDNRAFLSADKSEFKVLFLAD